MVETATKQWLWFLAGGSLSFLLVVPPLLLVEGSTGQDLDQSLFPLAAVASLVGLACAWRKPLGRSAFAGAALLTSFFALLLSGLALAAGVLLLAAAAWVVLRAPALVRLVLGGLFLWAALLVVAMLVSASDSFAPLSGLALAAVGLAYPLLWALRERRPWRRHAAWAAAFAWSALCLGVALLDVAAFGDGLAVVSALLLAGGTAMVVLGWLRSRAAAPVSFGST